MSMYNFFIRDYRLKCLFFQMNIIRAKTRDFISTVNICTYPQICIVGSGPAGFYTAQQILKSHPTAQVDIYEKLPVPFGLVRYGVAPDHPEVKNCINTFSQAAKNDRVSFLGNVAIGQDITLSDLKEAYHAIILAYGAAKDKMLNIDGENLPNVLSAKRLVGWYNGLPEDSNLDVNFDVEDVAIIGQGNVAIDVSRILLTSVDVLKKTDIPQPVLEKLSKSRIKRVNTVGRRMAHNVAFTIKELREMINLKGCKPVFRKEDFKHVPPLIPGSPRNRKRLLELLCKTALEDPIDTKLEEWNRCNREWRLRFLMSPLEIISLQNSNDIRGILFGKNRIVDEKVEFGEETEFMECGLVVRSIGYTSIQIDPSIPFDSGKGLIPNENSKVLGHKGLYVSGWIGTGPIGVILTTMDHAFRTGKTVIKDMESGLIDADSSKEGKILILKILAQKKVRPVTFNDWSYLDKYEVDEGTKYGKPREKVTDLNAMLQIAYKRDQ